MTDPSLATIVTGVDDGYARPLRVLIESLASSHGKALTQLEMVVLHASLVSEKRDQLKVDAARVGLSLEFRAVRPTEHEFPISGWVSDAVYLRLTMGEALPEASRVLYLDSDTIVLRDLRPLLARPLNGASLAAVRDPQNPVLELGIALPGWKELGLRGDREYFNSGVMLMDLDVCRRCGIFERARDFLVDHPASVRFWDQDALNWSVGESWHRLEREWNTFALTPLIERGDFVHYAESVMPLAELIADEATATVVKAGLWLLPGGHVDDGEDPRTTVLREASEELRIAGEFHPRFGDDPLFLTVTKTRGEHSHTDVSFWFVLATDQDMRIEADQREANEVRWFTLDDPEEWAHDRFDPHMARFRDKLLARLGTPVLVG